MDQALSKMKIEAYSNEARNGTPLGAYTVMFNPSSYTRKFSVDYEIDQGSGSTGTSAKYTYQNLQEYVFEFIIDGTGVTGPPAAGAVARKPEKVEVTAQVNQFFTVAGKFDGSIKRPPYLRLSYGDLSSPCVLKSADVTYTLFKPDGTPLRAKIQATFTETFEEKLRLAREERNSPDLSHQRRIMEGDRLPLLTHRIYGDASHYLSVARYNNLTHFRALSVGETIDFPPLWDLPGES